MRNIIITTLFAVTAAVATLAYAKAISPEKTAGLGPELYYSYTLGSQIASMEGYSLRGRKITFEPGGGTAEHSHADRPAVILAFDLVKDK